MKTNTNKGNLSLFIPSPIQIYTRFAQKQKPDDFRYNRNLRLTTDCILDFILNNGVYKHQFSDVLAVTSHVHFSGLKWVGDILEIGNDVLSMEIQGTMMPDNNYILDPIDYIGWIKMAAKSNPHIKWIWVIPPREGDIEWSVAIPSLNALRLKCKDIMDGFEFTLKFAPQTFPDLFDNLPNLFADYWLNVPHAIFFERYGLDITKFKRHLVRANHIIIDSFGYRRPWHPAGVDNPDSSLADWINDFHYYGGFIENSKISMGIDTCGVQYDLTKDATNIIPLYAISQMQSSGYSIRDNKNGHSHLKTGRTQISYDDEKIRERKTTMVDLLGLEGMVMGELANDHDLQNYPLFQNFASLTQFLK